MRTIKVFTKKSMKQNKKRTLMTIVGVALSVALILAVLGMAMSMWRSMGEGEKRRNGDYHVTFNKIPAEMISVIEANAHVKKSGVLQPLGVSVLENPFIQSKPYLMLNGLDETAMDQLALPLADGELPDAENEIALTEDFITREMPNVKIGDEITLNIGTRMSGDADLNADQTSLSLEEKLNPEYQSPELMPYENCYKNEVVVPKETKTYKVTGILKKVSYSIQFMSAAGYPGIVYSETPDPDLMSFVYVTFDDAVYYKNYTKNITYALRDYVGGLAKSEWFDPSVNDYVKYVGGGELSNNIMVFGMCLVIMLLVVVTSIFVIRNSFYISVTEKEVQLGMLRSIGATKRQMRQILYLEGFYIWLRGVVIGLILGAGVTAGLVFLLRNLLGESVMGMQMIFYIPWWAYILVAVISLGAVFFATMGPAQSAAKLSPIEAIRGKGELKVNAKKLKTSKFIRKTFGVGGTIAEKNLKRSRRQYRSTVISLVVGITIYIAAASFVGMVEKIAGVVYRTSDVDAVVSVPQMDDTEQMKRVMGDISVLPDADDAYIYRAGMIYVDNETFGTDEARMHGSEGRLTLVVMPKEQFEAYAKECGITLENANSAIVFNRTKDFVTEDEYEALNVEEGKAFSFTASANAENESGWEDKEFTIGVAGMTNRAPKGRDDYNAIVTISDAWPGVSELSDIYASVYIYSDDPEALQDEIDKYVSDNRVDLTTENYGVESKQNERILFAVKFFLYGFIVVITLIGVTNIFNTITTSMEMRSREFAMLRSIGMTNREFNRMIRLESVFYGMRSLIMGILSGTILSRVLYGQLTEQYQKGYTFPIVPILISILAVALIVSFTMRFSLGKIRKQNIIETIRRRNV